MPVERLRWITFGHVESDECGAMNEWLAAAPHAQVAHGGLGCMVSINDMADRPPRPLPTARSIDLGAMRVRHIDTPHVPHGWEARVLFEETTGTLLCGDLFTHLGDGPALTEADIVGPAVEAEKTFSPTRCLAPTTPDDDRAAGRAHASDAGPDARLVVRRRLRHRLEGAGRAVPRSPRRHRFLTFTPNERTYSWPLLPTLGSTTSPSRSPTSTSASPGTRRSSASASRWTCPTKVASASSSPTRPES